MPEAGSVEGEEPVEGVVLRLVQAIVLQHPAQLDDPAPLGARVGGNSRTPLGVVSLAENLIVAAMGAVMLSH